MTEYPTLFAAARRLAGGVLLLVALTSGVHAYENPIITNTRDPDCSRFDLQFHMIEPAGGVTNGGYYKYRTSTDLVNWSAPVTILQQQPGFALWQGKFKKINGKVYLYYTRVDSSDTKTIRVASADTPAGPFTDHGRLVTASEGIDPCPFTEADGTIWLYYKNPAAGEKSIWVQKLSNPTTKASGYSPKRLLSPAVGTWEDAGYPSLEGPAVVKISGTFFLLYTGGPYGQASYAVGYAHSANPDGPFTKYSGNPIMSNAESPNVYSPGVPSVVQDGADAYWLVYRQRATAVDDSPRQITIDKLNTTNAANKVINATATNGVTKANPVPLQ